MNLFFKECKIYILFFYITTWCRVSAFSGPVFICTLVKYRLESDKTLTATFPNGFRIYACKRAKNSTAFPRISQNIKSCNDSNSVEQLQKMRNVWGTAQSNLMRLLVLQMTVNEMLKNPQHLWHFLDLLKSLKTPRKSFLVAEKDNQCASSRTLLSFFPGLFFLLSGLRTNSDPIFCCWILDWSHLRQGRDREEGECVQSGRPWQRQSVVSSSFDFLRFLSHVTNHRPR